MDWNVSARGWQGCGEGVWNALIGQAGRWARVLSAGTMCSKSEENIHPIYNLPIVRDLGWLPLGTDWSQ